MTSAAPTMTLTIGEVAVHGLRRDHVDRFVTAIESELRCRFETSSPIPARSGPHAVAAISIRAPELIGRPEALAARVADLVHRTCTEAAR